MRAFLITEVMAQIFATAGIAYYVFFIVYPQSVRDIRITRNIERQGSPVRRMKVTECMTYLIMCLLAIELLVIALPLFL